MVCSRLAFSFFIAWPITFSPLNNLEIARQFPVRDVLAELAFFPFARLRVVLDEVAAEELLGGFGFAQESRRLGERLRQLHLLGELLLVGIAFDGFRGLDLVLDTPKARADRSGE